MGKSQGSSDKSERWELESPAGRTDINRLNWNEATAILNVLEHWGILGTLKSNRDHFQGKKNNSDLKTNKQTNCWGKVKPRGQDHQEQRNLFGCWINLPLRNSREHRTGLSERRDIDSSQRGARTAIKHTQDRRSQSTASPSALQRPTRRNSLLLLSHPGVQLPLEKRAIVSKSRQLLKTRNSHKLGTLGIPCHRSEWEMSTDVA